MQYRLEIDGLRALAVVPVILFHAGFEAFSGGFVGVDVFFVISGYLITTIILAELEQGKFSIVNFYERRARRILPALFLVMLVCIPFAWSWLLPNDMKDFSKSLVAVSAFVSNILFLRESGYFDTAAELKPLLHTWSLAVEEQYYVLFPLFLVLFWRLGKRWILILLGLMFVASLAVAQWASLAKPTAAFYLLPTRGWELLIGAFAAFYLSKTNRKEFGKGVSEIGGWLGLALILYAVFAYSKSTPFPGLYALVPTVGTLFIILFATQGTTVGKFVGNKAFLGVGLISYGAYLWHQPLFAFARHMSLTEPSPSIFIWLSVFALVLAYFSLRIVEAPFRTKGKFSRIHVFVFAFAGTLFFTTLGSYGRVQIGDFGRYSRDVFDYFSAKAESDAYVWDLKNKLRGVPFDDAKIKILLVGDSNSGDLINVLYASDYEKKFSFSTLTVNSGCGNLFLPKSAFESRIESDRVKTCAGVDDLMLEKNKNLMFKADWVIFASSWSDWESDLFEESYRNLVTEFGDKFLVFGNKHLDFSPIDYIRANGNAFFPYTAKPKADKANINNKIRSVAKDRFIDPYDFFCEDNDCLMVSSRGDLVLYDGFHLSKYGTEVFVDKLRPLSYRLSSKL